MFIDPVPTKLLKELLLEAEEPLLNIINSSLSLGHVPRPFKLAVIKPLIKKPKLDPCELANYRPISKLPFMSNIFEKFVSAQLCVLVSCSKLIRVESIASHGRDTVSRALSASAIQDGVKHGQMCFTHNHSTPPPPPPHSPRSTQFCVGPQKSRISSGLEQK